MFHPSLIALTVCLAYLGLAQASGEAEIVFELKGQNMPILNWGVCTERQYKAMNGHLVQGHNDDGWSLRVDTMVERPFLDLEYHIHGHLQGYGELQRKIADVKTDILKLDFDKDDYLNVVDLEGKLDPCNPWTKAGLAGAAYDARVAPYKVQATAPLMLEAIQDLLVAKFHGRTNPLVGAKTAKGNVVYIDDKWLDSQYFQDTTRGSVWATKDVMGFLSIVLTNMKQAQELAAPWYARFRKNKISKQGPSSLVWIMPRHYWTTVYSIIKEKLPSNVDLWDILENLACYQNTKDGKLKLDKKFCQGDINNPQPNKKLEKQAWSLQGGGDPLSVKTWVESIVNKPARSPDALSAWDSRHFRGKIGGFDRIQKPLQSVSRSNREAPLWEFTLGSATRKQFSTVLGNIYLQVRSFHEDYRLEPQPGSEDEAEAESEDEAEAESEDEAEAESSAAQEQGESEDERFARQEEAEPESESFSPEEHGEPGSELIALQGQRAALEHELLAGPELKSSLSAPRNRI